MAEINAFQQRLKQMSKLMTAGVTKTAEEQHKQLQRQIKLYLLKDQVGEKDKLSEIQITIYNNLGCLYEKKGKYKSSLFHLEIAEKLENAYFAHKYKGVETPPSVLEKIATTYSNMSAIQSKIGNGREALRLIEFAVDGMHKNAELSNHRGFVYLYYNYAVLLETNYKYDQASQFALLGQRAASHYQDHTITTKYEQLLDRLKEHLAKQEHRRQKEIRKYVQGEIGVIRNIDSISQSLSSGRMTIEEKEKMKSFLDLTITKNSTFRENVRSRSFYNQRSSIYRPYALPASHRRNFKSASHNVLNNKPDKIKEINTKSFNSSHQTLIDPNKLPMPASSPYGVPHTKAKACSLFNDSSIDKRIKEKKLKLENEISKCDQKSEVLEKIIEKLYLPSKHSKLPSQRP